MLYLYANNIDLTYLPSFLKLSLRMNLKLHKYIW